MMPTPETGLLLPTLLAPNSGNQAGLGNLVVALHVPHAGRGHVAQHLLQAAPRQRLSVVAVFSRFDAGDRFIV